jgi:exosome complex component RRP40
VNSRGKAAGFGGLVGGFMFRCSIGLGRSLLAPNCFVAKCLGKQLPYEMAVGMNGRVWVKTASHRTTIVVCTALQNSELLSTNEEVVAMVNAMNLKE